MERIPIPFETKPDQDGFYKRLMDDAFGAPIIFESVPSLSDLEPNSWGKNGTDIYVKFSDGTGIKIAGTQLS